MTILTVSVVGFLATWLAALLLWRAERLSRQRMQSEIVNLSAALVRVRKQNELEPEDEFEAYSFWRRGHECAAIVEEFSRLFVEREVLTTRDVEVSKARAIARVEQELLVPAPDRTGEAES